MARHMQKARLIFLPGNFICCECKLHLTAFFQAKQAAMSPLLPAQETAGSKSNRRQEGWLLTAVKIFCSSVTFCFSLPHCTTDVKAFPFKEATPQHPWRHP